MTATDTEVELVEREWLYMGRRIDAKGTMYHVWMMHTGKDGWYKKGRTNSVGGRYMVKCTEDGTRAMPSSARFIGPGEHDDIEKWKLEDRAAYLEGESVKAERKLKGDTERMGDLTLAEVRKIMWSQNRGRGRAAVITAVIGYLEGG